MINQDVGHFFSKTVYGLRYNKVFNKSALEIFTNYGTFQDEEADVFAITDATYVECELNNDFRRGYKIVNDDTVSLTANELSSIENWLINYFNGSNNYPDISLPAYDPNDNNLFQGYLSLSEIKKNNYYFTTVGCPYSLAKYNELEDTWINIKAIIRSDGSYVLDPDSYCEQCVLFLTEEEWEKIAPIHKSIDDIPFYYLRYDFVTNDWKDIRTPKDLSEEYALLVKARFSYAISSEADYYFGTDNQYAASLSQSANIAVDYTSDNYKNGVKSVAELFGVSPDVQHEEDFTREFYEEMFKQAREHLEGQRDLWLALPNKLKSEFYDLTTTQGWLNLIDRFRSWFESTYAEYPTE